ncbi:hypothetical protein TIFTF001_019978 [Ficus carica]|uniref:Uncharacterized protein n=1 Tax=Ficus carica TaxID=3494 RepID=A0AA88ACR0_FICCA|nr:hypothetical protein TIFTF001_019978 [Ficus carica]
MLVATSLDVATTSPELRCNPSGPRSRPLPRRNIDLSHSSRLTDPPLHAAPSPPTIQAFAASLPPTPTKFAITSLVEEKRSVVAEISWNGLEENNQEMILTAVDPMAEAANRLVATGLAYSGVRSRKAAENSTR